MKLQAIYAKGTLDSVTIKISETNRLIDFERETVQSIHRTVEAMSGLTKVIGHSSATNEILKKICEELGQIKRMHHKIHDLGFDVSSKVSEMHKLHQDISGTVYKIYNTRRN
jgi:uncharacterized coiled-coil DUF342 family protein